MEQLEKALEEWATERNSRHLVVQDEKNAFKSGYKAGFKDKEALQAVVDSVYCKLKVL